MSTVKWLVVRCQMYLVRLPDRQMGSLLNGSFGNLVVETSTLHIAQQAESPLRLGDHVYCVKLIVTLCEKEDVTVLTHRPEPTCSAPFRSSFRGNSAGTDWACCCCPREAIRLWRGR